MASGSKAQCRIGVDVGGTFTDLVLSDPASARLVFYKEPSTPEDPSIAVERGVRELLQRAGLSAADVLLVVHGTTLGLNTIIQRKGARTALVVSRGNRDVLELARSKMPSPYNFYVDKEQPLVPRDLVFEVSARMAPDGTVLSRASKAELEAVAHAVADRSVSSVAVMLLNAYIDPALEQEVAESLAARLDGVLVTRSAEVWSEIREYERGSLATMNAYVHPLLDRYFSTLERRLTELGSRATLYITTSNGGMVGVETARRRPVDTLLSGPASGVVAASRLAQDSGGRDLITIDMGGTSCDMAVIQHGEPEYTTRTQVGDFPLVAPVVNVSAIGAGGGSLVWLDAFGVLKVGPESAGADPGPACYGGGGAQATITDCYLATGLVAPDTFLGGRLRLDPDASAAALEAVAEGLGITGDDRVARAAEAALKVATAKMATELYKGLAQRGLDPREFTLVPFGGAGPTHSGLLAEEARLMTVLVPAAPGTFCAMGAIVSDVQRDYARTVRRKLDGEAVVPQTIEAALKEMEAEALDWLAREGSQFGEPELRYTADMRYVGQAYELIVAIPAEQRQRLTADSLAQLFHQEHARIYGFPDHSSPVEVITLRVRVVGKVPPIVVPTLAAGNGRAPVGGHRSVFHAGQWMRVPIHRREDLRDGHELAGPAIVEQEDSTIWILPSWHGRVDRYGNLPLKCGLTAAGK